MPRPRGRPRKYESNAARQKSYRDRVKKRSSNAPTPTDLAESFKGADPKK